MQNKIPVAGIFANSILSVYRDKTNGPFMDNLECELF